MDVTNLSQQRGQSHSKQLCHSGSVIQLSLLLFSGHHLVIDAESQMLVLTTSLRPCMLKLLLFVTSTLQPDFFLVHFSLGCVFNCCHEQKWSRLWRFMWLQFTRCMLPEAGFYSSLSKTENSIHASVISINLILKTGPSSTVFKYTFSNIYIQ